MSYTALYRKFRPTEFADVKGQDHIITTLQNQIKANRIGHAYLFCGPRGTGKTSSARIFAKSLNCVEGPTVEPCQKCASCIDITNATGMDVIEIDAATNRGVEGAEDLIAQVHYAPVSGKYKIFIIDEVHMLTATAFNALLKTFEEPPENVIFILATTEPHKVLETIVSRCQRFDFRRITVDDITKRLREISDIENIKITDDALFCIAKNVSGGLRDSLALLDQVSILGAKEEITKDTIEELLGKVTFDRLIKLLDLIIEGDIEKSLELIDDIYLKGSEPRNLCENFMEFLRNIIITLSAKEPQNVTKFSALTKEDIQTIVAKNYDKNLVSDILNTAIEYFKEVKFATNPYLWVELMVIEAARIKNTPKKVEIQPEIKVQKQEVKTVVQPQEPKKEVIQEPKEIVQGQPQETKEQVQIQAQSGSEFDIWSAIVNSIESVPAKFFYSGMAKLVEIDDNRIILGFINQNVITQAKSELKHKALIDGEKRAFGGKYIFEFVQLGGDIKPLEGAIVKPVVKPQIKPQIQKEEKPVEHSTQEDSEPVEQKAQSKVNMSTYSPKVQEMLEAFSGKIID